MALEVSGQVFARPLQGLVRAGGQHEQVVVPVGQVGVAGAGACSRTTWAFVPPRPNELTAARRGRSPSGHSDSRSLTRNGLVAKSICGFGALKLRLGGISRVLERQHRLDDARDPGARVEMADVGLDRPDPAIPDGVGVVAGTPA